MDYFADIEGVAARALAEDTGSGDLTALLAPAGRQTAARVICREAAVICGRPWVDEVFRQADGAIRVDWRINEGARARAGDTLLTLSGPARGILTAERTALNFLQFLSGVATRTRRFVELVADTGAVLLDTRKTIPGLRLAQKYAVKVGGAENHRIGLFDAFLIKENHIAATGSITGAVTQARRIRPGVRVEVEVARLAQLDEAMAAGPDWILLDNFTPDMMREAVRRAAGRGVRLEASGGVATARQLQEIARTGVDYISMGALTKHCEATDLSLMLEG